MKRPSIKIFAAILFAVALLSVATLIQFRSVWSNYENKWILGRGDVFHQSVPYAYFMDHSIHEDGDFPTWNPLVACGMPYAANPLTMATYPPNILRSLLVSEPTPLKTHLSFALMTFLHIVLGGVGAFVLARRHKCSLAGATVAGLAFALSSPFFARATIHPFLPMMAAWTPWIMILEHKALAASAWQERIRFALVGGAILGVCLLAGFAQLALYIGVLTAGYWFLMRFAYSGASFTSPRSFARLAAGDGVSMALLYGSAVLIAAVLFVPAAELTGFSGRSRDTEQAVSLTSTVFEYTPLKVAQLLTIYTGFGEWRDITACGAVAAVLALGAFIAPKRRDLWVFAVCGYLLLDCSLGAKFLMGALVQRFAPFEIGPAPRAAIILCLPIAMLAGLGVDALINRFATIRGWALSRVAWLAMGVAVLIVIQPAFSAGSYVEVGPGVLVALIGVVAVGLLLPWLPKVQWCAMVLPLLLFVEVDTWSQQILPRVYGGKAVFPGDLEKLKEAREYPLANRRGITDDANINMYDLAPAMNGYDSLHLGAVHQVLCKPGTEDVYDRHLLRTVATENTRGNLLTKRLFWLSQQYVDGPLPPKDQYFPSATTAFLQGVPELPVPQIAMEAVPPRAVDPASVVTVTADAKLIQKRLGVHPDPKSEKARTYYHFPPMDKPTQHSALFMRLNFSAAVTGHLPIREVLPDGVRFERSHLKNFGINRGKERGHMVCLVLPDYDRFIMGIDARSDSDALSLEIDSVRIEYDAADEDDHIQIVSRTADSIEVELRDLPEYRVFTYLDAMYPGWEASIDGEPTPIYSSAEAFKAVVVPPGTHRVRFEFHNRAFAVGAFVSLISTFLVLGSILALYILERRRVDTSVAVDGA